jgi:hypothetical protein
MPTLTITYEKAIGQLAAWMRERMDWSNDEAPVPPEDQELWFHPLQAQVAAGAQIESTFTDADEEFANEEHHAMPLRWTLTRAERKAEALATGPTLRLSRDPSSRLPSSCLHHGRG